MLNTLSFLVIKMMNLVEYNDKPPEYNSEIAQKGSKSIEGGFFF
jgi:hypothetical protein